jgi:hypothetical protein
MRPIFFLHLTKTGGQTLAARLAASEQRVAALVAAVDAAGYAARPW